MTRADPHLYLVKLCEEGARGAEHPAVVASRERADAEVAAQVNVATTEIREALYRKMRIPKRHWARLADPLPWDSIAIVRDWLPRREKRPLLSLAGGKGVGKSFAACLALAETGTPRRHGRFIKAMDLVRASTFDVAFWDRLASEPMLVIDECGSENVNENSLAGFRDLLDRRYDEVGPTILTTNRTKPSFLERYGNDGGRLLDRLVEAGSWLNVAGESKRRPGGIAE